MKTGRNVLTRPPDEPTAQMFECPYCNDTGYVRTTADGSDPLFDEADRYEPCPYCNAPCSDEDVREPAPPDAPYDPEPKASGCELKIFAVIGLCGLLISAAIGAARSLALTRAGAIASPLHGGYAVAWVLLALAVALLAVCIVLFVVRRKRRHAKNRT